MQTRSTVKLTSFKVTDLELKFPKIPKTKIRVIINHRQYRDLKSDIPPVGVYSVRKRLELIPIITPDGEGKPYLIIKFFDTNKSKVLEHPVFFYKVSPIVRIVRHCACPVFPPPA